MTAFMMKDPKTEKEFFYVAEEYSPEECYFDIGDRVHINVNELFKIVKYWPSCGTIKDGVLYDNENNLLASQNDEVCITDIDKTQRTVLFTNKKDNKTFLFKLKFDEAAIAIWPYYKEDEESANPMYIPCGMCFDATCDPSGELTPSNDGSFMSIGKSQKGFRMMYQAGMGKPNQILFERWNEGRKEWETVGFYEPTFCPNCGRKLKEITGGK